MSRFTHEEIWNHNGLLGVVVFACKGIIRIMESKTATPQAKAAAQEIHTKLDQLVPLLKERDE